MSLYLHKRLRPLGGESMNHMEMDNTKLIDTINTVLQIPGVKVDRKAFLLEQFKELPRDRETKEICVKSKTHRYLDY